MTLSEQKIQDFKYTMPPFHEVLKILFERVLEEEFPAPEGWDGADIQKWRQHQQKYMNWSWALQAWSKISGPPLCLYHRPDLDDQIKKLFIDAQTAYRQHVEDTVLILIRELEKEDLRVVRIEVPEGVDIFGGKILGIPATTGQFGVYTSTIYGRFLEEDRFPPLPETFFDDLHLRNYKQIGSSTEVSVNL